MASMFLSKSAKSLVALITVIALLSCHAAFASQAGKVSTASAALTADIVRCHAAEDDTDTHRGAALPAPCDSAQAVGDTFKLPQVAITELPVLLTALEQPWTSIALPPRLTDTGLAGASPPLRLLHCRLRN